ncbi:MAG: GAF domain-containing protein [Deltaproteobacteria bacterium]|jgi:polysaccharide biosynthesis protein PelD|nr:GAF domain-containing protein [Deltaproteobacteria bacterium]
MYDRIIQIKRSKLFYLETAFLLVIFFTINAYFFPKSPAFRGITPNPLWVVILIIPARYGRNGALFASAATSLFFVGYYSALFGLDILFDNPWLFRFPFLFMLVGFLLGELKTVFIIREDYLTNRIQELQNLNEKLVREHDIIKEAHKDLSEDIATKQDSLTIFHGVMDRLNSFNSDEIYHGLIESLADFLNIEECSIYELEGNILKLKLNKGWKDYHKRPDSIEIGKGLAGIAASRLTPVTIKSFLSGNKKDVQEMDVMGDCLFAIPIVDQNEHLYGVISVEKMPFIKLTDATIQTARIICEIAATSLGNAALYNSMADKQIFDEKFGIFRYGYFLTRLNEEFLRSLNYMTPLSIIVFKWSSIEAQSAENKKALLSSIISLVKNQLRSFDVTSTGPINEVPLVILLAMTPKEKATSMKESIIEKLKEYSLDQLISEENLSDTIVVQDYNPNTMNDYRDMLKQVGL